MRTRSILALDSCGRAPSLALGELRDTGMAVLRTEELAPRTVSADLVPAFGRLLGAMAPAELAGLVVLRGPGSFTGIRVGLSAMKALSEAAGIPLLGLSRLAVLAGVAGCAGSALDAGRGQVYLRSGAGDAPERLASREEALEAVGALPIAVCDERLFGVFPGERRVAEPAAADALRAAVPRLRAGEWDDALTLDALYLWREDQMFARPQGAA